MDETGVGLERESSTARVMRVALPWLFLAAAGTWALATGYFPGAFPGQVSAAYWELGAAAALLGLVSFVIHELGHGLASGQPPRKAGWSPLSVFGTSAASGLHSPTPAAQFWTALAGPALSLLVAAVFRAAQTALVAGTAASATARYLTYVNGGLGLLNLLPGFPFDGGVMLCALLWSRKQDRRRATEIAAWSGRCIGLLMVLIGLLLALRVNPGGGIWLAVLGSFLTGAAGTPVQESRSLDVLSDVSVGDGMQSEYGIVGPDTTVAELVRTEILAKGQRCFLVTDGARTAGLISLLDLERTPKSKWELLPVAQLMTPLAQAEWVRPETQLLAALQKMDRCRANTLPVVENGVLEGMLARYDILQLAQSLSQHTVQPGRDVAGGGRGDRSR